MFYLLYSFLAGSALQLLATGAFWLFACGGKVQQNAVPRQLLNRFYGAELVKWVIVVAGFSGIWAWGCLNPCAVLVGFFMPQLIYWKLLFWQKSKKISLSRKTAA